MITKSVESVNDTTFESQVESVPGLTLVDFWAPWCAPCRLLAPTVERLAEEYQGRVTISKFNIDEGPATAARFRIRSIPSLLFFRDGENIDTVVGVESHEALTARIDEHLRTAAHPMPHLSGR